ncbi:hypothetical protein [Rhizobium gallicum]
MTAHSETLPSPSKPTPPLRNSQKRPSG